MPNVLSIFDSFCNYLIATNTNQVKRRCQYSKPTAMVKLESVVSTECKFRICLALLRAIIAICFIETQNYLLKSNKHFFIVYIKGAFIKRGKLVLSPLDAILLQCNNFMKQRINVSNKVLCSTFLRCCVGYKCIYIWGLMQMFCFVLLFYIKTYKSCIQVIDVEDVHYVVCNIRYCSSWWQQLLIIFTI